MGAMDWVKGQLKDVSFKAGIAELVAMTLFVFIGCGTVTTFSSAQGPKYVWLRYIGLGWVHQG